jgi:hypothetical protein
VSGDLRECAEFGVARNPQAESELPYRVRLPFHGGLMLKARESLPPRGWTLHSWLQNNDGDTRWSRPEASHAALTLRLAARDRTVRGKVLAAVRRATENASARPLLNRVPAGYPHPPGNRVRAS